MVEASSLVQMYLMVEASSFHIQNQASSCSTFSKLITQTMRSSKTKKPFKTCLLQADVSESVALAVSNDDLLTEILIRLPATSILRFKSVSKHWLSLLSHPHFTRRFDKLLKSPGCFTRDLYLPFDDHADNRIPPPFRALDFCFDPFGITIVGSCNGLLLCCSDRYPQLDCRYYVFNPTTKQFAIIPSVIGGQRARKNICFMGLAFHQTDCVHYKLVCVLLTKRRGGQMFQIQVFSSLTRKWKISIQSCSAPAIYGPFEPWMYWNKGVYWNGAVYWAPPGDTHYSRFKIDDEQLQTLPLQEGLISSRVSSTMYFGESRDHLHLILHMKHGDNSSCLNVYEMPRDHSGWFVKYQLDLDQLRAAFPEIIYPSCVSRSYSFSVCDVVRGEAEEDTFMVMNTMNTDLEKIITYNVRDKSFKQILTLPLNVRLFEDTFDVTSLSSVYRYTETLTPF